jgi:hypothetical protein
MELWQKKKRTILFSWLNHADEEDGVMIGFGLIIGKCTFLYQSTGFGIPQFGIGINLQTELSHCLADMKDEKMIN